MLDFQIDRVQQPGPMRLLSLQMKLLLRLKKGLIDVSENANRSGFKNIRDILNINFFWEPRNNIGMQRATVIWDHITGRGEHFHPSGAQFSVGKTVLNIAQNIGTKAGQDGCYLFKQMGVGKLQTACYC